MSMREKEKSGSDAQPSSYRNKTKTEYLENPRDHPEFKMTSEPAGSFKLIRFSFCPLSDG